MPKFFVRSEQIKGGIIRVEGPDFDHIVKVRRGAKGQAVTLSDENGFDYSAEICEIGSDFFLASILDKQRSFTELDVKIHIDQAIPKSSKMELVIQKNVELGAFE